MDADAVQTLRHKRGERLTSNRCGVGRMVGAAAQPLELSDIGEIFVHGFAAEAAHEARKVFAVLDQNGRPRRFA